MKMFVILTWILLAQMTKVVIKTQVQQEFCSKDMKVIRKHTNSNYIIGGLFPFHYYSDGVYKFNPNGLLWSQAMIHTIDEINKDQNLLPNVTLGYEIYDTCNTISIATEATLRLINIKSLTANNLTCSCDNTSSSIIAMIGDAASATTTRVASIMSAINTAQISYSATSTSLSEKQLYPSFLRTIPPDDNQALLLTKLMVSFGWDYINVIACDDDYGRVGSNALIPLLRQHNICVAVNELRDIRNDIDSVDTTHIVRRLIKEQEATTIILWCQSPEALKVLRQAESMKLYHRTWIATEAFASSDELLKINHDVIKGMFGITFAQKPSKPFEDYLQAERPVTKTNNPWLNKYWKLKGCTLTGNKYQCSDNAVNLSDLPGNKHINVINGVYAIANGLDKYITDKHMHKSSKNNSIMENTILLEYIKNTSFVDMSNTKVAFNDNGDPVIVHYSINNLKKNALTSQLFHEIVGTFANTQITWTNRSMLQYSTMEKPPSSTCKTYCIPGYVKITYSDRPCCWSCIQCTNNSIQPKPNQNECFQCKEDTWSNMDHTRCLEPTSEYFKFTEPMNLAFVGMSMISAAVIFGSIIVIVTYRDTPVVRALNLYLSLLQLLSNLVLTGLPLVTFLLQQNTITCKIQMFYFLIPHVIALSVTFTKADFLVRIFKASKSGVLSKRDRIKSHKLEYFTVVCLTIVGLILCTVLYFTFPVHGEKSIISITNDNITVNYHCSGKFDTILFILLAYLSLIALICGVCAFKARKLPARYNEAKYTSFAMFIFLSTWILFAPIYRNSTNSHFQKLAIWCYATLVSDIGMFSFIYLKKVFIILFQPQNNTRERFRQCMKVSSFTEFNNSVHICAISSPKS